MGVSFPAVRNADPIPALAHHWPTTETAIESALVKLQFAELLQRPDALEGFGSLWMKYNSHVKDNIPESIF